MNAPSSLDTRAITFEQNMLQRIPAFMHNKAMSTVEIHQISTSCVGGVAFTRFSDRHRRSDRQE